MGIEIDFLPVGEESRGGDAIALRYGNLNCDRSEQTVIVIDGGYAASGEALVDHVSYHYGTDHVDIVLSTHPDQDHVGGLEVVVEKLSVGQLLMHQPWRHSAEVASAKSRSFRSTSLAQKLEESLREASELERLAELKGIPIVEPFAGMATNDGAFRILGPSLAYYEQLLLEIEGGPSVAAVAKSALSRLLEAARSVLVPETYEHETLRDDGVTSPQNNTSVISLVEYEGYKYLFTGDAGIPALEQAADRLELQRLRFGARQESREQASREEDAQRIHASWLWLARHSWRLEMAPDQRARTVWLLHLLSGRALS
jgi:hypothetical protein